MKALLLAALPLMIQASPLQFSIAPEDVDIEVFEGMESLRIPGGSSPFEPGDPALPGTGYAMVIPQGTRLVDVEVEILSSVELPGTHLIAPVLALPLDHPLPAVLPRSEAYSGGAFPTRPIQGMDTGTKTGYRIASFSFVPFSWNADSGELSLVTEAILTPVTAPDPDAQQLLLTQRQLETAVEVLQQAVDNPEMIAQYSPGSTSSRGAPWVVIADQAHQATLQPLIDLRAVTHGSDFVSTQWIYANYDGRDTQEQIRNYLKDAYENGGLVYALIVGDFGETTRLSSLTLGGNTMNAVADLYYSDLDGDWDMDGDSLFGELSDAVDYYSDIYVGRFSTDVPSRLQTMVEKAVAYETESPEGPWRTTALLAGAGLWVDDPPGYWGSFVCDSIDKRIPESWTVHKLYEDYESHPNNQIELYNEGVSYSSVNGHGNSGGVYWYYPPSTGIVTNSNYSGLTNHEMPVVFHSMACHPGHLQNVACSAERLMFWPDGGGIAVMYNSHWGIGTPPGIGPSEYLEIYFAEVLLEDEQYELGVAHAASKDQFKAEVVITYQRWILQENNFLGDPALRFAAGQTGITGGETQPGQAGPTVSGVYPSPASDGVAIAYRMPCACAARVVVYDLSGRMAVRLHDGQLPAGSGIISASVAGLPCGCYLAAIESDIGVSSASFLVLR